MFRNLAQRGPAYRWAVFITIFGGGLMLIVALTVLLVVGTLSGGDRSQPVALSPDVAVQEFAVLPDNDAYPAAVAVAPDGTVYTGSYVTGALWAVDAAGEVIEIPGTRDAIGAVAGLTVAPDGTVYIVDQWDADPRTSGGDVKRLLPGGTISVFASINDERGFVAPDDVTLDSAGNVYVSDRGRDEVWRFAPDGSGSVWWIPPTREGVEQYEPTGLAYDPAQDALLVTDGLNNLIYRVALTDGATEILYDHGEQPDPPGFDGLTLGPDGMVYVAALGQRGVARLEENGSLTYIAGLFRGVSDVDFSPPNRLIVANFDSYSLAVAVAQPSLPFSLDVIELDGG
ncbi:MAG: SMP-30/gluconolactonase/LRE family protein [Anaerolineaceae bacterium]|nr:SMP-30/gluconolactonase/LRE family protein [Anaerolineaceae bacterium]